MICCLLQKSVIWLFPQKVRALNNECSIDKIKRLLDIKIPKIFRLDPNSGSYDTVFGFVLKYESAKNTDYI
mgnify:CR=1 FL=1